MAGGGGIGPSNGKAYPGELTSKVLVSCIVAAMGAFGGEMRPPIFDELNTSVSHVGDLVSSHMHDLRSE
ncbi:hypothetical protein RND71_042851 [Anisodus tanguticus]|uniref:Uncharacterized protein n=1 Tax=Anisodus tanguticus TaxID=243964 RepID=A0AAE1UV55_9SOLA|nr:hypothetical protein RND71_042851 [Anisodus tanguticus]